MATNLTNQLRGLAECNSLQYECSKSKKIRTFSTSYLFLILCYYCKLLISWGFMWLNRNTDSQLRILSDVHIPMPSSDDHNMPYGMTRTSWSGTAAFPACLQTCPSQAKSNWKWIYTWAKLQIEMFSFSFLEEWPNIYITQNMKSRMFNE